MYWEWSGGLGLAPWPYLNFICLSGAEGAGFKGSFNFYRLRNRDMNPYLLGIPCGSKETNETRLFTWKVPKIFEEDYFVVLIQLLFAEHPLSACQLWIQSCTY